MKIFNYLFFVLFTISAVLQYNDPDPLLWIAIYGFAALICLQNAISRAPKYLMWAAMLSYFVGMVILFPGVLAWAQSGYDNIAQSMKAEKAYIEETREFFGLLIAFVVVGVNVWVRRTR